MDSKYSVVDLFSGAGGLSLGFEQTGKFEIKVAFESNPSMQETYRKNHPSVDVRGNVCEADYKEIKEKYGHINVVIGGPPCQGFSNANRQKNCAISQNNMLVKEYIRAIRELEPDAFIMENVSMLRSDVHRFYLDSSDVDIISRCQIPMRTTKLLLLEDKYYFFDALQIVQDPEKINKYLWPEEQYCALNIVYKAFKNPRKLERALNKYKRVLEKYAKTYPSTGLSDSLLLKDRDAFLAIKGYYWGLRKADSLKEQIEPAIMIQRMLRKAQEIYCNKLVVERFRTDNGLYAEIQSYAVFDYLRAVLGNEERGYHMEANVLCAADFGAPQKRMRFIVMGIKHGQGKKAKLPIGSYSEGNYRTVRDAIKDLQSIIPVTEMQDDRGMDLAPENELSELGRQLRDSPVLYNHIITKTGEIAMTRFKALKPGQNFHALDESLKTNTYTDASRTQNTIYLRLDYDQPSGTVINVRKSMWIHPVLDRAISIREAARLQTFPDSFRFYGSKDKQYQQVGNAVPPIMAKAIAEQLVVQMETDSGNQENQNGGQSQ